MTRARLLLILPCGLAALAGCAGPIETRSGYDGTSLGGLSAVAVVSSKNADNIAEQARAAVAEALARRNVALVVAEPDGPKITVTVSERPASLAVVTNEGQVLSGAKRPRLFQDCADRTQRLLLVLETAGSPPVRAWAEEDHCKSDLVANVAVLAERAVAALADRKAGVTTRSGRD